jgi:tRNA splicing ligase
LITNKSLFAKHMFNDNNDNNCEVLKGHQLKKTQDKFLVLSSLNVRNLVAFFKHRPSGGYIDNILELKFKNHYDFIQECCFLGQISS